MVSLSTPHIYTSVLPFTSSQSLVRLNYWQRTKGLLQVEGKAIEAGARSALASWSVGSVVRRLALSRDGRRIVSGSEDFTLSIWDVSRGTRTIGPLDGHRGTVWSVTFSPDDTRIASGSEDCTIRIWDANTGILVTDPLLGHEKGISGLTFSPDSSCLVSSSEDHTMRMWDGNNGTWLGKLFEGHEDCVMSVMFSPDGKRIASAPTTAPSEYGILRPVKQSPVRSSDIPTGSIASRSLPTASASCRALEIGRCGCGTHIPARQ